MKFYFPKMISLFAIGALMFSSCGGDSGGSEEPEDTEKPTISTVTPAEGEQYAMTQPFVYKGTFADNEELSKVVFTLEDQKTEGTAGLKAATGTEDEPWEPDSETINLSGDSQTLDQSIFTADYKDDGSGTMGIPKGIYTGKYTLTITCTDKAGNETSESVEVEIW